MTYIGCPSGAYERPGQTRRHAVCATESGIDPGIRTNGVAYSRTARSLGVGMSSIRLCRLCGAILTRTFVDLGMSPLCESYVPADKLDDPEVFYPLHVLICDSCLLVQIPA